MATTKQSVIAALQQIDILDITGAVCPTHNVPTHIVEVQRVGNPPRKVWRCPVCLKWHEMPREA